MKNIEGVLGPPRPFVKWVGGKRQLLAELHRRLPEQIERYFEPFVGGGALMWSLAARRPNRIVINDYNAELVNVYRVVRDHVESLIEHLAQHQNSPDYFYQLRGIDRDASFSNLSPVDRASRFIYLNKTGYNGLYRVNSKGQHNVPFGKYAQPVILDRQNLLACSAFLQGVEITQGDFDELGSEISSGDFVYFDPPYVPLSASSSFTSYTDQGFDDAMQARLKALCDRIHGLGGKFMLSNSAAPLVRDLYADYFVEEVWANRAVNSKSDGRGKIAELVVRNYGR